MTAPSPAPSCPQIAVSLHAWDPYYVKPGGGEVMGETLRAHLDAIAKLNDITPGTVTRVRVDYGWSAAQPTRAAPDADYYYNRRFVRLFEEMRARALTPYVMVHQAPAWARPADTEAKHLPGDPASIEPFAAWFAATYSGWVREVEFWNEPNLAAFAGKGWATAARYVPVLKAFYGAATGANPRLKVIGGNVSQCDWAWLRDAYDLGFGEVCDIVGVHPYQGNQAIAPASTDVSGISRKTAGWEKGRISAGLPRIGDVMDAYGDSYKPIWATEVGWSASTTGVGTADVGTGKRWATMNDKAAEYQSGLLEMLAEGRDDSVEEYAYRQVRLATVYEAYDPATRSAHQKGFEILEKGGGHKPQARALAAFRRRYPRMRALY